TSAQRAGAGAGRSGSAPASRSSAARRAGCAACATSPDGKAGDFCSARRFRPADTSTTTPGRRWLVGQEFNVLALIKGEERYVYVYDDQSRGALVEFFHAQAADPDLTLSWFDAAVLTRKAEEQAGSPEGPPRF